MVGSIKPLELTGYRPARPLVVAVGIPLNLPRGIAKLNWPQWPARYQDDIPTNWSPIPELILL